MVKEKCQICAKRREYIKELDDRAGMSDFEREKMRTNHIVNRNDGTNELMETGYVETLNECTDCGVNEKELGLFKSILQ